MTRILAISSGGGHWIQLLRLRPAFEGQDVAFASVFASAASDVPGHRFHRFDNVSRENMGSLAKVFFQVLSIVLKERPDVVITTGALPALFALAAGRLIGCRTLWIDSIANSGRLSTSGRQARWLADRCVTQWPHLVVPEKVEHWGAVL